jgi:hypothetical protein
MAEMRLARLLLCSLGLVACARPSLDELEDAGDAPVADAGHDSAKAPPEPVEDSAIVEPVEDAAKPEGRDAGVETVVDASAEPTQDAGCANGSCVVSCAGETVNPGVELGSSVKVNSVTINGKSTTLENVFAGEAVDVTLSVTISNCGLAISAQQVFVGVESSAEPECASRPCTEYASFNVTLPFTIDAPTEKGLHYILAGANAGACVPGVSTPDVSTRVAALCVSPR